MRVTWNWNILKSPNHSNRTVRHFGCRRIDRRRLRNADDGGAILAHRSRWYHDTIDRALANRLGLDHLGVHGPRQFSGSLRDSRKRFRRSSLRRQSSFR